MYQGEDDLRFVKVETAEQADLEKSIRQIVFVQEQQVAGRDNPTMQVMVDITRGGNTVRNVPFVVVRSGDGQWLVEEVDLERVMSGG